MIPGLGRSAGEGRSYPLQYSWASFVTCLVKNPPKIWDTWVQSLGWEDPLENGKATHSTIFTRRIPWTEWNLWVANHGIAKSRTWLNNFHFTWKKGVTIGLLNISSLKLLNNSQTTRECLTNSAVRQYVICLKKAYDLIKVDMLHWNFQAFCDGNRCLYL